MKRAVLGSRNIGYDFLRVGGDVWRWFCRHFHRKNFFSVDWGQVEGHVCTDPGARTPIGASGIFFNLFCSGHIYENILSPFPNRQNFGNVTNTLVHTLCRAQCLPYRWIVYQQYTSTKALNGYCPYPYNYHTVEHCHIFKVKFVFCKVIHIAQLPLNVINMRPYDVVKRNQFPVKESPVVNNKSCLTGLRKP